MAVFPPQVSATKYDLCWSTVLVKLTQESGFEGGGAPFTAVKHSLYKRPKSSFLHCCRQLAHHTLSLPVSTTDKCLKWLLHNCQRPADNPSQSIPLTKLGFVHTTWQTSTNHRDGPRLDTELKPRLQSFPCVGTKSQLSACTLTPVSPWFCSQRWLAF